jgi:hypothetical protein
MQTDENFANESSYNRAGNLTLVIISWNKHLIADFSTYCSSESAGSTICQERCVSR